MITILPIKRKWVGEWLKVPHRFICSAIKCFAATYSPFSLILSIAASYRSIATLHHISGGLQLIHHHEKTQSD
jgi:hypothetical protein